MRWRIAWVEYNAMHSVFWFDFDSNNEYIKKSFCWYGVPTMLTIIFEWSQGKPIKHKTEWIINDQNVLIVQKVTRQCFNVRRLIIPHRTFGQWPSKWYTVISYFVRRFKNSSNSSVVQMLEFETIDRGWMCKCMPHPAFSWIIEKCAPRAYNPWIGHQDQ